MNSNIIETGRNLDWVMYGFFDFENLEIMAMWSEIDKKLKQLKQFDQCFVVDGAKHYQYITKPIDNEQLLSLEQQLKIEIPTQFRSFLLNFGNSCCGPDTGITSLDNFELYSMALTSEYDEWFNEDVQSFMSIGWGSYISEYCIVTSGNHLGMMYEFEGDSFFIKRADSFMAWYSEWLRIELRCFEVVEEEIKRQNDITEIMMNLYISYKMQPTLTLKRLSSMLAWKDFDHYVSLYLLPSFQTEQQARKIYLPEKVANEFKLRIAQYLQRM